MSQAATKIPTQASAQSAVRSDVAVWFEIPAMNFSRAVRFYETILKTPLQPEKFGPHELAVFPHAPGTPGGCVMSGDGLKPARDGTVLYLNAGSSLDAVLERVFDAGGSIVLPRTALPEGMGFFAHIVDTEGNRVGLHALN